MRWRAREIAHEGVEAGGMLARRAAAVWLGRETTWGVAALVLDGDGRLLLVRVSYRRGWALPGGFLKRGEDPACGVVRELAEETGLPVVEPLRSMGAVEGPGRKHRTHVFGTTLTGVGPALVPPRPWEIRAVGWFRPDALPPLHPMGGALVDDPGLLTRTAGRFALT